MNEATVPNRPDPYRWGTIFAVLSLDVTSPFVSSMGLQIPRADEFRAGLRKIIEQFRDLEIQRGNVEEAFLRSIFDWAAQEFEPSFSEQLYSWGENIFQSGSGSGVNVFLWNNIVRRGGLNGERDKGKPPHFVTVLRGMLANRSKPAVNKIRPTSAWDKKVYERQQYDEFRNAMELVQATISYNDFVTAWQEARNACGHVDMEEISKWGAEEAAILGMPLDRVGKPGDWGSGAS